MSDINFDCPRCGGNLLIDEKGAGREFRCTHCEATILVPDNIVPCAACGVWVVVGTAMCPGCGKPFAVGKRKTEIRLRKDEGRGAVSEPPTGFVIAFAVVAALFVIGGLVHWVAGLAGALGGLVMTVLLWRRHMGG